MLLLFSSSDFLSAQQITTVSASRSVVGSVEQIAVGWESLNEYNWCYFDVKREANYTGGYTTIYTMRAMGNTNQPQSYLYIDLGPFGPTDIYCYRIEVWDDVDLDAVCEFYVSSITACDNSMGFEEPGHSPFLVYPNPANGKISLTNIDLINSIEVYNLIGEVLYTSGQGSSSIDISDQANGIYFVMIKSKSGTYCEKIVKE